MVVKLRKRLSAYLNSDRGKNKDFNDLVYNLKIWLKECEKPIPIPTPKDYKKPTSIITVTMIFPFWLRWAKQFVGIRFNRVKLKGLQGHKITTVVIDEIQFDEEIKNERIR